MAGEPNIEFITLTFYVAGQRPELNVAFVVFVGEIKSVCNVSNDCNVFLLICHDKYLRVIPSTN